MVEEIGKQEYARYDRFAIGIGDPTELESAQRSERIAAKIEAHSKRFYLLSYCTPSRKGQHIVRIESDCEKAGSGGSLEDTFVADGFGPRACKTARPCPRHSSRLMSKPEVWRQRRILSMNCDGLCTDEKIGR